MTPDARYVQNCAEVPSEHWVDEGHWQLNMTHVPTASE